MSKETEIRQIHFCTARVETGPIRFGDDWPGVFLRGDDAQGSATALRHVMAHLDGSAPFDEFWLSHHYTLLENLAEFFESCKEPA